MKRNALLNHLGDVLHVVRTSSPRFPHGPRDLETYLNELPLRIVEPSIQTLIWHCPVPGERRDVRDFFGLYLQPYEPPNPIGKSAVDGRPDIGLPVPVEREVDVGPDVSHPLQV